MQLSVCVLHWRRICKAESRRGIKKVKKKKNLLNYGAFAMLQVYLSSPKYSFKCQSCWARFFIYLFFYSRSTSVRFGCFYVLMSHVQTPVSKSAFKWLSEWCFWGLSMQVHHYTKKDEWLNYEMTCWCAKTLLPDVEYAWNHLFARRGGRRATRPRFRISVCTFCTSNLTHLNVR